MARNPSAPSRRVGGEPGRRAINLRFIGETVSELRRVTWPAREETTRLTVMVLAVAAVVGVFLYIVDLIFAGLIGVLLGN